VLLLLLQNMSNTIVSASADRKLILWDTRLARNTLTLSGHNNAVSNATFNFVVRVYCCLRCSLTYTVDPSHQGDQIASVDASGVVNVWDVRTGETAHAWAR
jgi:WD40 repeat protein